MDDEMDHDEHHDDSEGEQTSAAASETAAPPHAGVEINPYDVRVLVLNYLLHNCYVDTAQAFIEACNLHEEGQKLRIAVQQRKDVLQLVRRGAIEEAIQLINTAFPQLLDKQPTVLFKLLCQRFIELIRQRKKEEALLFAQKEWSPHVKEKDLLEELHDVFALIAYEDPENSPVSHYMADGHRDRIARSVNSAILEYHGLDGEAGLEVALRQLVVVRQLAEHGKQGIVTPRGVGPWWNLRTYLERERP